MSIKQFILRWLGVDKLLAEQQTAFDRAMVTHRDYFNTALSLQRMELMQEFEERSGIVLDASITASGKIARIVASHGDGNLKEYIDSCFAVFQEPTTAPELTN